ncbi:MAG: TetR/AcrR family transcriptional regulator [Proteobacteria bacterium]|nr:TetR/AcrR family transcriptional regulator [Pseudomonadota bacterium]
MSPTRVSRGRRVRRGREEARQAILEAAEKHLCEGGPDAVRVQRVAADVGFTDAAVHHHFGNRRGLLEALLAFAARRMRAEIEDILAGWDGEPEGLRRVAELLADTYADKGYARLALWLRLGGWESRGSGLFTPLVDAIHRRRLRTAREHGRPRPRRQDTQRQVALLNVALAAEPLLGAGFLRSVDLPADPSDQAHFRHWLAQQLSALLEADA